MIATDAPACRRRAHFLFLRISRGGKTLGFDAINEYFPDLGEADIILTNAPNGSQLLDAAVFEALHPKLANAAAQAAPGEDPKVSALAADVIEWLQTGEVDRSRLTDAYSAQLTPSLVAQAKTMLGTLGPALLSYVRKSPDGTTTKYDYRVRFSIATLLLDLTLTAGDKVAQARAALDLSLSVELTSRRFGAANRGPKHDRAFLGREPGES